MFPKLRSVALSFLAFALLALPLPTARGEGTINVPNFTEDVFYTGNGMISMRFDFGGRLWVIEKQGRILVFSPNGSGGFITPPTVFANYTSQVNDDGESGMLGLALDPDFQNNRLLYVFFTTNTDQRLLKLTSNATFTAMVPGSETILLSGLPKSATNHKSGDIQFHPTDPHSIYVTVGDDANGGITSNLDVWNGKILKINSSDGKGLSSNPYYNGDLNSIRSRVWSAKYRNAFRFAFDPATPVANVLYISENGDGQDRIARIERAADGGWNNQFFTNGTGRKIMDISAPSKTGIVIIRSGPLAVGGQPTLYNARQQNGFTDVKRWLLTTNQSASPVTPFDTLTPVPGDPTSFWSNSGNIASFTTGPDGWIYFAGTGQGPATGTTNRLGRIKFVGGTNPVANFTSAPGSGQSPLQVTFTDTSTAPSSTIASRTWEFGDGTTSTATNPTKNYAQPGVYTVKLTVTNAEGLANARTATITAYHQTSVTLTGQIRDGRSLAAGNFATATELRFYQKDGVTPLAVSGGSGVNGNILAVAAGGAINVTFTAQITGDGLVVSAGEATGDGVEAAFVGLSLSTTAASQSKSANFYLSDVMLRGCALDPRGVPAQVDIGVSRGAAGSYYAFAGGRDFLGGSNIPASGVNHRTVADALGYYHVPIPTGGGNATFYLDTSADTLSASHGNVKTSAAVTTGTTVKNLTIGLYHGGTGEADLSGIAVTPNVSFANQIQPLLSSLCVACHTDIATNSGGLDLQTGASFGELVGKESTEAPGVKLVQEGSASRSYLMEKINAAVPQFGNSMRPGDPMPLAQQALIRDWINQLIPPDLNAPPVIDSVLTKSGIAASPLTYQITAINLPTSFGATNLPPGLSINTSTGLISGSPSAIGTTNTIITATNGNGTDTETLVFTITAGPAPVITSALTASGPVNTAFSYTITAANGATTFGATGLPAGLSINTSTGVISGTPTSTATANVTITATSVNGTDTETLAILIHGAISKLSLGQPTLASSTEGGNIPANGNDADATNTRWTASDGTYPQWWRVDLGVAKLVTRVDIKWYGGTGRSYRYTIAVSNDDTNYTQVVDKSANSVPDVTTDSFTATGRYVRINVTGSTAGFASFYDASVFGTDIPPSTPATLAFSATSYSGQEGAAGTTATITVRRTGDTSAAVGVTASTTTGGSATAGSDYTAGSFPLSWAAGNSADKTFTISILPDLLAEGNETVALQLASPTGGAVLGTPATATLTILDRPFDAWRSQVFGPDANTPQAQPLADYDNDGVNNFSEWYLGGNPTTADGESHPTVGVDETGKPQISFTRNLTATGVILRVQAANSLTDEWQVIASKTGAAAWVTTPGVTVNDNASTGEVTVIDANPVGTTPRFLRLQIERTTD